MSSFGVELYDRAGSALVVAADMQLTPLTWGGAALGGPRAAEIRATGSRAALKDLLLNALGYRTVITTPSGGPCWWGYVHAVALSIDGVALTASLDGLRNRVAATYSSVEGAVEEAGETAWADDLASQGQYGVKEHYESLGQASAAMALASRDRLLAKHAYPRLGRALVGDGGLSVTLHCRGHYTRAGWRYWRRSDGRLEHMPGDTLHQPIGWGVAASGQVGFGDSGLHDAWGRLGDLAAGMKLAITGAANAGNNKTYTVLEGTAEEVESYSNNTIYFQPTDDILDGAAGMGMVKDAHWLLVGGSAANSRWHRVGSGGADHVRTSASVSGAIAAEGTGPTIDLYQAQRLSTVETTTYEAPGTANVTVQHHGQQVAQRITLPAAMKLDRVTVEVAKVGNPAGQFLLRIHADSAGGIGAQLTTGGLSAAALTDNMTAVAVPVTEIALAAGNYWLLVRRADANDGQNYYKVGMTAGAYGTCQMWTGSAWVAHAPGWFLKFGLAAVEDTGTIIETMLQGTMQGVALQTGYLSGVNGHPTTDGQAVALDELERLAAIGTSAGARVLVDITPDLVMRLYSQAGANVSTWVTMRTAGGRVEFFDAAGSPWPRGLLPVGLWAELADIDSDLTAVGGLSPAFLDEVEYDAEANAWTVTFEGERNLADMLKVQAG